MKTVIEQIQLIKRGAERLIDEQELLATELRDKFTNGTELIL